MALSDEFDFEMNIIVSDKSPLGRALIGAKVGDSVRYFGGFRADVLKISLAEDVFNEEFQPCKKA